MRTQLVKTGILFGVAGIIMIACNKSDTEIFSSLSDSDIILAKDDVSADEVYQEVDGTIQEKLVELDAAGYQPSAEKSASDDFTCLEITVDHPDSTRFPKVITFDYGTGCEVILKKDTVYMEGKMIVTLTDRFLEPAAQRIVTFEDFYVNEMKVEGVMTNTFIGLNDAGYLEFNLLIEEGKLIFADSLGNPLTYTREADFTKQWLRNRTPLEDTVLMDGSMWGMNVEGLDYSREIIETLVMVHCPDYGRRWAIVDGQVVNTVDGVSTTTDYSDGGCDGTAIIWRAGTRHMIRIRAHHRHRHHGGGGH
jgi:hypothetical protein